jgi:hypothetical protein
VIICRCGAETSRILDVCAKCGDSTRNAKELCGGCGAETHYITVMATSGGKPLAKPIEKCPECNGSRDRIRSVTDRKLWQGHEVYSEHYKKTETADGETIYKASDSLIQDLAEDFGRDPDREENERRLALKRRNRRTRPMSQGEIEAVVNQVSAEVKEARRTNSALDAGLILPDTL